MPESHMSSDGTTIWWPAAERRWRLCAISETGTQSAARYRGAVPIRQRRVKMMTRGVGSRFSLGGTPVSMMYNKSICLFVGAYINLFISPSPKTTTKARFNQCFLLSINKNDVTINMNNFCIKFTMHNPSVFSRFDWSIRVTDRQTVGLCTYAVACYIQADLLMRCKAYI